MQLNVKRLTNTAKTPTKANTNDAGFDLYLDAPATLWSGQTAVLPTGIAMQIPPGYVGQIWPRSKLAAQYGLDTLAGVVDADYTGEIKVSIVNHGKREVELKAGDRIAQILIVPIALPELVEVNGLADTPRGKSGINDSELRLR